MSPAHKELLLDTGPLVALLNQRDQWHRACVEEWSRVADQCVTTEAVVTEATHMVSRGGGHPALLLEFLLAAELPILGLEADGHRLAARLMRKYQDTPMDYADATLIVAGAWLRTDRVFTLDRRGFKTYRTHAGNRFHLTPGGPQ